MWNRGDLLSRRNSIPCQKRMVPHRRDPWLYLWLWWQPGNGVSCHRTDVIRDMRQRPLVSKRPMIPVSPRILVGIWRHLTAPHNGHCLKFLSPHTPLFTGSVLRLVRHSPLPPWQQVHQLFGAIHVPFAGFEELVSITSSQIDRDGTIK